VEDRPGHERRYVLDYSKIHNTLGWSPVVQFEDGIRDTVKWYADHREWWEPLKRRKPIDESAWRR
jgi:dTDP-glucose 4,6-dehydratase